MSSIDLVRQSALIIAKQAVSQLVQQPVGQLCCGWYELGNEVVL